MFISSQIKFKKEKNCQTLKKTFFPKVNELTYSTAKHYDQSS